MYVRASACSAHRAFVSLRTEMDPDDGDGYHGLGAGDITVYPIKTPGLAVHTLHGCKAACTKLAICRAVVWSGEGTVCSLKAASLVTPLGAASSPTRTVWVRAFARLIGQLPYDAQVTPTVLVDSAALRRTASEYTTAGLRIDIRTDSYYTDGGSDARKRHGVGIPGNRAAYIADPLVQGGLYETPGWLVGHEVVYSVDRQSPLAPMLLAAETNDSVRVGYFESG